MLDGCTLGVWKSSVGYVRTLKRGFNVMPLSSLTTYNSAFPDDRNNGALWSGRGVATSLEGGAIIHRGRVTVALLPILTYQANQAYETLPGFGAYPDFGNGLYPGLDEPQRFGSGTYANFDPGQSFVRLDAGKLGIGVSNENVWWGPGFTNAILFTNTAPGFPHVFLNIQRPINVGIGKLTGEAVWGRLSESKYFDADSRNDHRLVVGGLLTLEPKGVSGLFLGFGRTFVVSWDSASARSLFPFSQAFLKKNLATASNPSGNNEDDQRLSFMGRYVLPESGFEVYSEWAREDASYDLSDLIQEPEHASGRLLGLQKLFKPRDTRWVRAYVEATNLQILRQDRVGIRPAAIFYLHSPQGHTQRGQLLGASIGPGSESQLIGVDVLGTTGLLGFYFERVRQDEFSLRGIQAWSTAFPPRHDVSLSFGSRFTKNAKAVRVDADFALFRRRNRNFIRDESGARGTLRMTWTNKVLKNGGQLGQTP
ncbi:MAG TPA: capsule assembly Wzi family protein [Gemmatimonadaceae bacterium]|nr:capsule assembly Wzi family protein [Gemmatimonadaceae bacterium]